MKEVKKINCIIDTDPGVDDIVAITLSLYDEIMDIKLITTLTGNLDLEIVTRNMMHTLEKFKRTDIPVAKGAKKALCRSNPNASFIHQQEGMGGYTPPKTVKTKPIEKDAVEEMYEVIKQNKNDIVIISLGPHTNVGTLIRRHPNVVDMVSHIYCEGCAPYGWKNQGKRWMNYVSFNASSDPEAMDIVLTSGIPITIIPSRMGRELANFNEQEVYNIREINDVGRFFYDMYSAYWEHNYPDRRIATNDTCAVMAMRFPKMFKMKKAIMKVDTEEMPGRTTVKYAKNGNVNFVYAVRKKKMHDIFYKAIEKLSDFKFYKD